MEESSRAREEALIDVAAREARQLDRLLAPLNRLDVDEEDRCGGGDELGILHQSTPQGTLGEGSTAGARPEEIVAMRHKRRWRLTRRAPRRVLLEEERGDAVYPFHGKALVPALD